MHGYSKRAGKIVKVAGNLRLNAQLVEQRKTYMLSGIHMSTQHIYMRPSPLNRRSGLHFFEHVEMHVHDVIVFDQYCQT